MQWYSNIRFRGTLAVMTIFYRKEPGNKKKNKTCHVPRKIRFRRQVPVPVHCIEGHS